MTASGFWALKQSISSSYFLVNWRFLDKYKVLVLKAAFRAFRNQLDGTADIACPPSRLPSCRYSQVDLNQQPLLWNLRTVMHVNNLPAAIRQTRQIAIGNLIRDLSYCQFSGGILFVWLGIAAFLDRWIEVQNLSDIMSRTGKIM